MQEALDWIHTQTGQHVTRIRHLVGGLTSDVRAVTLTSGETLVLRRYTEWGKDAAKHVEREAAALEKLVISDIPAPRLVAAKASGDVPMLLMTRLPAAYGSPLPTMTRGSPKSHAHSPQCTTCRLVIQPLIARLSIRRTS